MKKNRNSRWGPAVGVLAVGMLAFSLSLEGAPTPRKATTLPSASAPQDVDGLVPSRAAEQAAEIKKTTTSRSDDGGISAVRPVTGGTVPATLTLGDSEGEAVSGLKFGHMPSGELPVFEAVDVDYRNDEGSRLRQAGELVGPYRPHVRAVAAGGCSFDIDCDDCNPCTVDVCNIAVGSAFGTGTCSNSGVPNGGEGECSDGLCCNGRETCQSGNCQAPGSGTGTFDPGACQFPCSGGNLCNEASNLCRPPCDGTNFCAVDGLPCTNSTQCNPAIPNNYCKNCNDGVLCNGTESCVSGVCQGGTNPCGPGALCGERDCSDLGVKICTSDSDCVVAGANPQPTCSVIGPICQHGRCCNNTTPAGEPACTKRTKASCDSSGGAWYATDLGFLTTAGGSLCPTPTHNADAQNNRTLCPKYSSGVAPPVNFTTEIALIPGPFSDSPCDHVDIGDDYEFENGSFLAMERFRWVGGGGGRLTVEFYDELGNFIEDVVTGGVSGDIGVRALRFVPTLTLPAKGFVVIRVASQFAPNGRTFWVSTDAAEEGINDSTKLWIDGAPVTNFLQECVGGTLDGAWCDPAEFGTACVNGGGVCTNRPNVLAFEIEGEKTNSPAGACCLTSGPNSDCDVKLPWRCAAANGSFAGPLTRCFVCDLGTNPGAGCGLCSGGGSPGAACQSDSECQGGDCVSSGTPCLGGGVCVTEQACATGACCNPTTGECDDSGDQTTCVGGGGTFQGYGTTCDPNCCLQPAYTGGDNCEDVTINVITVPASSFDPPKVVTVSGDNSGATGPDSCLKGAWNASGGTVLTVDPGWWEGFSIDKCAFVRVDFCCSEPTVEPQWSFLWKGCPCDVAEFTSVNPNVPAEAGFARGGPYCDDDNLWMKFGPLPAGTYYVPVYSLLQGRGGNPGPYQMHITVDACPIAACCSGASCSDEDQLSCAAIENANFLAPPFRTVPTTACSGSTCATGSCCYTTAGEICADIITNQLATPTLCSSAGGLYRGGARCRGGVCSQGNPPKSCANDVDCGLDGICLCNGVQCTPNAPESQQPSPCPICDVQSIDNCQLPTAFHGARLSDLCVGDCVSDPPTSQFSLQTIRVADDFTATVGGQVTSVCVWGIYFDQNAGGAECIQSGPPEKFTVTIYSDLGGLPGPQVGSTLTSIIRKGTAFTSGSRTITQWQLGLNTPISLTQGNTYWLEVVNNTDESTGLPGCDWMWTYSDPAKRPETGNALLLQDAGSAYTFGDAVFDLDMAWCINLANSVPAIQSAPCCKCGGGVGTCSIDTLSACTLGDGQWYPGNASCATTVCRNTADAADTCVTDKVAVATNSATPWNNLCTNTDGPTIAASCNGEPSSLQNDLWYTWTADCTGDVVIETCDLGGEIDTVMAIYTNGTGTCPCPSASGSEADCNDDGCVFSGAGSSLTLPATSGVCYTIRVGAYLGEKGQGALHVGECSGAPPPPSVLADPTGINKSRFLSFSTPASQTAAAAETALRVKFVAMHVVVPPYTGGPSTPFTLFNGLSQFVGPPTQYVESASSGIQFYASKLQCAPHYQDWSTVGLLHVTGYAIVPSSEYQVENLAASCMGSEGSCTAVSAPVTIKTTRWGDVAAPFNPPDPSVQPAFSDIGSLVDKFKSVLGAPIKARAMLVGVDARGDINITPDVGFTHIAGCVDGFKGLPYPHKPGKCGGAGGSCISNADCTGANTPPCTLCP